MTGLFGYISHQMLSEEMIIKRNSIISSLAISMQDRADDAIGVNAISGTRTEELKKMLSAFKFVHTEEYKKLLATNPPILIGATNKFDIKVNKLTQLQPIQVGATTKLVGTYDGLMTNRHIVYPSSETDAQAYVKALWMRDTQYPTVLTEISGGKTGVWWNAIKEDSLQLIKSGNPLAFVVIPEIKTIFYCSSKFSLQAAINSLFPRRHSYSTPEENCLYTITQRFSITKKRIDTKSISMKSYTPDPSWVQKPKNRLIPDLDIIEIDKNVLVGCQKCKKELLAEVDFYFHKEKKIVRCTECGKKSYAQKDWSKMTQDDYIEMIESVNWGGVFI